MQDLQTSPHRREWDAIPWVVNGSAGPAERRLVYAHVATCADCQAELAFHQRLHDALAPAGAAPDDAEPALQRFWTRVDAALPDVAAATSSADTAPLDRPPPGTALAGSAPPRRLPRRRAARSIRPAVAWRWLSAAVVVQAVGLAALAGTLWQRSSVGAYETLSHAPAGRSAARIRLVPAPGLTVGEFRALLARSGLQVDETSVDAATFGVSLRPGAPGTPVDLLGRLRAEPGVALAEPIDAAPAVPPAPTR